MYQRLIQRSQQSKHTNMAKPAQQSAAQKPTSLLGRFFMWMAYMIGALFISLFISLLIEWIGLFFVWYDEGASHSANVLAKEREYLALHNTNSVLALPSPSHSSQYLSDRLFFWVVTWTGLEALFTWMVTGNILAEFIKASLNTIQIFFIRVAVTITALPLFFIFAYWGGIEGMIRRDLRRFGGDIEHGMLYHYAKHVAGAVFILPIIFYLAWPEAINPAWVFVPFALILGLNMMVVTRNFIKYV